MKPWLVVAGLFGLTAVGMGAFAAHGLKSVLAPEQLAVLQTGVQYQLWQGLALLLVALLLAREPVRLLQLAAWGFALGTVLFSGSLYCLALSHLRLWAFVTPVGGFSFLVGWALMLVGAIRLKRKGVSHE